MQYIVQFRSKIQEKIFVIVQANHSSTVQID